MGNKGLLVAFVVLLLSGVLGGCTTTPRYKGVAQENAEFMLGMTVDAQQQVVAVSAGGAAAKAGVEVGDGLVSLTWVLSEAPEQVPGAGASSAPLTTTHAPFRAAPGVENKTVPFTQPEGIRTLTGYGVPLRLEIVRQGEPHVLTIIPQPRGDDSTPPAQGERY